MTPRRWSVAFTGAALAVGPIVNPALAHAATTSTPGVTRYVPSTINTWIFDRTDVATRSVIGIAHGGEAMTGTWYSTGWFQVSTGANKGRWLYGLSATPTAKPIANDVTRYTGTSAVNNRYVTPANPTVTGSQAPLTALVGDLYADGWFQIRTPGLRGGWLKGTTIASNPYTALETQQWRNTTGFRALAPTTVTVSRYVLANSDTARVHSRADYAEATVVGKLPSGTKVSGKYVNSHWFQVTSGTYAGKYLSSGQLYTIGDQSKVNGKLPAADLCTVPSTMRYSGVARDANLGCEALQQLIKLDSTLRANVGFGVRQWDSYRDYGTQVTYYTRYYPYGATPGTSNHGLGNAIDLQYGGSLSFGSPQVVAFTKYGPAQGWTKPAMLGPSGANPEPWHFEFTG